MMSKIVVVKYFYSTNNYCAMRDYGLKANVMTLYSQGVS